MLFWRKDYFETLKTVADEARALPHLADYAAFLEEYEKGLRDPAFRILQRFISGLERAPFSERKTFVLWLQARADNRPGRHLLIPYPLHTRIVEPTLLEWTMVEPRCSEPHRRLGGYGHLKLAVELDPNDHSAIRKLIVCILGRVGSATDHLPRGYPGKTEEDLATLKEAEMLLPSLPSDEERARFATEISENRALIEEYLRKR